jgi:hypothetical protein
LASADHVVELAPATKAAVFRAGALAFSSTVQVKPELVSASESARLRMLPGSGVGGAVPVTGGVVGWMTCCETLIVPCRPSESVTIRE